MPQADVLYKSISKEERIFSFLVVLMALAHVYKPSFVSISFGEILIFASMPLYYRRGLKFPLEKYEIFFIFFFFYMTILSLIMGIYFDAPMSKLFSIARAGFYWIVIFYFGKNLFNRDVFEKWVTILCVMLSIFIFIQFAVFTLTGYFIPGYLLNVPLNDGGVTGTQMYKSSLAYIASGVFRPHGFFAEPAHSAEFLFIAFLTTICNCLNTFKKKIFLSILFSVAIILMQSTEGYVLLLFVWFVFMTIEKKLGFLKIPLIIIVLSFVAFFFLNTENTGLFALDRIIHIFNANGVDNSSTIRMFNGLDYWKNLPFAMKIFGTGEGITEYAYSFLGIRDALVFMNTWMGKLFTTGVIGFLIYLFSFILMFFFTNLYGKCLVLGLSLMSFGSSLYCQPVFVWAILLMLYDAKERSKKNEKNFDIV